MIYHIDRMGVRRKPETCAVCGKRFERSPEHVFKQTKGGVVRYACSWTCHKKQIESGKKCIPGAIKGKQKTREELEARIAFCREKMAFYEVKKKAGRRGSKEQHSARCSWYQWRDKLEDALAALEGIG